MIEDKLYLRILLIFELQMSSPKFNVKSKVQKLKEKIADKKKKVEVIQIDSSDEDDRVRVVEKMEKVEKVKPSIN